MHRLPLVISLASYIFGAYASQQIFSRLGVQSAWLAWIPVVGLYPTFVAGEEGQPLLWTILAFIPLVNIISGIKAIIAWVKIAGKLGKSPWILLVFLVPYVGSFIAFWYLAFA